MRVLILWLSLFWVSVLEAQVSVSTSLPANTFLKYEGIPLRVEITNRSGEMIRLGGIDTKDFLLLRVRDLDNRIIPRTETPLLSKPWFIAPGETAVRTFDLVQLFRISHAMSYRCLQNLDLAGESYEGKPLLFDVVNGQVYEEIKRRKADRIFTMIGINRNGGDEVMLRVSDFKETTVLATYFLERHLRFYPPFLKVGKEGQIGTLHYMSPNQLVHCKFKVDGTPIGRTYYSASPGVPVRLMIHPERGFLIQGGVEMSGQSSAAGAPTR